MAERKKSMRLDLKSNFLREGRELLKSLLPASARRRLRRAVARHRVIASIPELEEALRAAETAFERGDAEGRRVLATFSFAPPTNIPADPYSQAYKEAQLDLYGLISGRLDYCPSNELSRFDLEEAKRRPFPYSTGDSQTIGDQLIAQGFLLKAMDLRPGARVLEFGPGWGNTTMHFLQLGCHVTAVDVDPRMIELLHHRNRQFGGGLETVNCDMLTFRSSTPFDAVLFFESFHHCLDHLQMLRNLEPQVSPQGAIVFASEPIDDFPYPWGIRLDGLSLWSARKYGWLELGFTAAYFKQMLQHLGWVYRRLSSRAICGMTDVIMATRCSSSGREMN